MSNRQLWFEGPQNLINEIYGNLKNQVTISKPTIVDVSLNPLDAPVGADELKLALEGVLIIIESVHLITILAGPVKNALEKFQEAKVVVRNPVTNKKIGEITSAMTNDEITRLLKR